MFKKYIQVDGLTADGYHIVRNVCLDLRNDYFTKHIHRFTGQPVWYVTIALISANNLLQLLIDAWYQYTCFTLVQYKLSNRDPMTHSITVTEDEIRPCGSVFIWFPWKDRLRFVVRNGGLKGDCVQSCLL